MTTRTQMQNFFGALLALSMAMEVNAFAADASSSAQSWAARQEWIQGYELRPMFSYAYTPAAELNGYLESQRQASGIKSTYNMYTMAGFGVTAEVMLPERTTLGIRAEYLKSSTDAVPGAESKSNQISVNALPVYVTLGNMVSLSERFGLGGAVGAGLPLIYNLQKSTSVAQDGGLAYSVVQYSARPWTFFVTPAATFNISDSASLRFEAGYRFLTSREFRKTDSSALNLMGDILVDSENRNVEVSSSGWVGSLAFVVNL